MVPFVKIISGKKVNSFLAQWFCWEASNGCDDFLESEGGKSLSQGILHTCRDVICVINIP